MSSLYAMLLAVLLAIAALRPIHGFYMGQRTLRIVNWLENEERLMVHCWSKDGSMGTYNLGHGEEFKWKFRDKFLFGDTSFHCDLEFNAQGQSRRGRFTVYDTSFRIRRRDCYKECMWGVGVHGLYAFDEVDKRWDYEIPWPSRNRFS